MAKFGEKDLNQVLSEFDNKSDIEIKFENDLSGSMVLRNAIIKYDKEYGFINIEGIDIKLKINTTLVYKYKKENEEIIIILDTLTIKIRKHN